MPKNTTEFQQLVTALHECIASNVTMEASAFLVDKDTKEKREVDIVLRSEVAGYPIIVSIEVAERTRAALGTPWVEEMAMKHKALDTNHLVLVSNRGFSKPATIKAKSLGIETLTLEDACNADWNLGVQVGQQGILESFTIRFDCSVHIAENDDWLPADVSAQIVFPDGRRSRVKDVVECALFDPTAREALLQEFRATQQTSFHATYDPPEGSIFEWSGKCFPLVKLSIGLELTRQEARFEFALGRFRDLEIAYSNTTESGSILGFLLVKREDGRVELRVYDRHHIWTHRVGKDFRLGEWCPTSELLIDKRSD